MLSVTLQTTSTVHGNNRRRLKFLFPANQEPNTNMLKMIIFRSKLNVMEAKICKRDHLADIISITFGFIGFDTETFSQPQAQFDKQFSIRKVREKYGLLISHEILHSTQLIRKRLIFENLD